LEVPKGTKQESLWNGLTRFLLPFDFPLSPVATSRRP
jgi:hypothetical protein